MSTQGLCFRCEHRAAFWETGHGPRCECGDVDSCVVGCYMYCPVLPVLLARDKGDRRPQFAGSMLSARSHFAGLPNDMMRHLKTYRGRGNCLYWAPKGVK